MEQLDQDIEFKSINTLVKEYEKASTIIVLFNKNHIKESKNKIHYVKPLAICVDGELIKEIEWYFNIRDNDFIKIRKYEFFGISINCEEEFHKKLRDGTDIKYYKTTVNCISDEKSISKLIDEPLTITL